VNLSLAVVNAVIVRVLAPASGVTFALLAADRELGLLHLVAWPPVVEWALAVLALDLAVYIQHRLFHAIPLLWRLHRLHHADRGFDFTTGVRFHPGEIALSALYKGAGIVALGASPGATLAFEIVLSTGSLFSHANARVAGERFWRLLLVTPDMHRVHHSTDSVEQNTNFGFSFSWWDRIGGTYRSAPRQPHETMPLGAEARQP
jgi:sterol desaturase/sphingolipid hydroxylase (fatty acid hydroxylase superfamily)